MYEITVVAPTDAWLTSSEKKFLDTVTILARPHVVTMVNTQTVRILAFATDKGVMMDVWNLFIKLNYADDEVPALRVYTALTD